MSARKELIAFPTIHSKVPSTSVVFVSEFGKWVTFKMLMLSQVGPEDVG